MKIKQGDTVLVTAGKSKGKLGKVMRVYRKTNRITVEKVNLRTRHIRRTPAQAGQKIQYEAPFDASNVMLVCPSCKKATRVGYRVPKDGKKIRICKKCNESVDQAVTTSKKK